MGIYWPNVKVLQRGYDLKGTYTLKEKEKKYWE